MTTEWPCIFGNPRINKPRRLTTSSSRDRRTTTDFPNGVQIFNFHLDFETPIPNEKFAPAKTVNP